MLNYTYSLNHEIGIQMPEPKAIKLFHCPWRLRNKCRSRLFRPLPKLANTRGKGAYLGTDAKNPCGRALRILELFCLSSPPFLACIGNSRGQVRRHFNVRVRDACTGFGVCSGLRVKSHNGCLESSSSAESELPFYMYRGHFLQR